MIKQWYIRTFRKRVAIRVFIALEDKRTIERWVIPKLHCDDLDIKGVGVYKLVPSRMYLTSKNVPTYYYRYDEAEPCEIHIDMNKEKGMLTPQAFQKSLHSKALKEAFNASQGGGLDSNLIIMLVAMAIGFMAVIYFQNEGLTQIQETLSALGIGG